MKVHDREQVIETFSLGRENLSSKTGLKREASEKGEVVCRNRSRGWGGVGVGWGCCLQRAKEGDPWDFETDCELTQQETLC